MSFLEVENTKYILGDEISSCDVDIENDPNDNEASHLTSREVDINKVKIGLSPFKKAL